MFFLVYVSAWYYRRIVLSLCRGLGGKYLKHLEFQFASNSGASPCRDWWPHVWIMQFRFMLKMFFLVYDFGCHLAGSFSSYAVASVTNSWRTWSLSLHQIQGQAPAEICGRTSASCNGVFCSICFLSSISHGIWLHHSHPMQWPQWRIPEALGV